MPFSGPWNDQAQEHFQHVARSLCHRKNGVGAQGLAVLVRQTSIEAPVKAYLNLFTPGFTSPKENLDALLAAGKFLFDTGTFGTGTLTIETPSGPWEVQAVDSTHFRTRIPMPTSQTRPLNPEGPPLMLQVTAGNNLLQALPLEAKIKAYLMVRDPAMGNQSPALKTMARAWVRAPKKTRLPLLATLFSREEMALDLVPSDGLDYSLCAALSAAGVWALGMTEKEIFVHQGSEDYFVEIDPGANELRITAPVQYTFFGTFSWAGLSD